MHCTNLWNNQTLQLCLNAKCHAIRDAQVVEKRIVAKEYAEDEKRLDDMMEQDRINAIKTQEEMEEMRKATRYAWVETNW